MEFAKYYDVTNIAKDLMGAGQLGCYKDAGYEAVYVCSDTHDFWVGRVLKGYNKEYEQEDGAFLVERNKIDKYEFIEFYCEASGRSYSAESRGQRDMFLRGLNTKDVLKMVLRMDDEKGLEGWDNYEAYSMKEAIDVLDGGFGFATL